MVTADDDGKRSRVENVRDPQIDLVERLLDVGRDDKDVAGVADRDFLEQVHAKVGAVGVVESRDAAHRLGAEPGPGAIRRPYVEWCAHHADVELADVADVLHVRRLQECVYTGEHRIQPAGEQRDVAVIDGPRRFQTQIEAAFDQFATLDLRTSLRRRRARIPDSRLRSAAISSSENFWPPELFGPSVRSGASGCDGGAYCS